MWVVLVITRAGTRGPSCERRWTLERGGEDGRSITPMAVREFAAVLTITEENKSIAANQGRACS